MTAQFTVHGETPPTLFGRPMSAGDPATTDSTCGVAPGSTSVTSMSNGANCARTQVMIWFHAVSPGFHGSTVEVCSMIDERFVLEFSLPGVHVPPFRFMYMI